MHGNEANDAKRDERGETGAYTEAWTVEQPLMCSPGQRRRGQGKAGQGLGGRA